MDQVTTAEVTELASDLADDLAERGLLRDPAWRRAITEVHRHIFALPQIDPVSRRGPRPIRR
jgi:hypothetical protein